MTQTGNSYYLKHLDIIINYWMNGEKKQKIGKFINNLKNKGT